MIASNNGHLSTVSMLVDNGANVGLCDHVSTQSMETAAGTPWLPAKWRM
jgi:ankyrin repeat protein